MKKNRLLLVYVVCFIFFQSCEKEKQSTTFKTWEDYPECNSIEPDYECIKKMFTPLLDGEFPFDYKKVNNAFKTNETYIAPDWQLTALHVLEANLMLGTFEKCYFEEDQYADSDPFNCPGVGTMLLAGGHTHTLSCKESQTSMGECVDQVPLSEVFDIAIVKAPTSEFYLQVAKQQPSIDDCVYLISNPNFYWLAKEQREQLENSYPLVSSGKIIDIQGRAIITNTRAFNGSSGGVLLNERGEVLGVASSLIGHIRRQEVFVPEPLSDYYTVIVGFNEMDRDLIMDKLK